MIRTGEQYRSSIRDGREVHLDGERVTDVATHPTFKPLVELRARIHDMQHEAATAHILCYREGAELSVIANKLPLVQGDWWDKRRAADAVLEATGGGADRLGDGTVGEMWSLFDGQDVLNELDPQFSANIRTHIHKVVHHDLFHLSAGSDPGDSRSDPPLRVVKETDAGILVRGAIVATAAVCANQAFIRPAIADWGDAAVSDQAVGFICDLGGPGVKHICRTGLVGGTPAEEGPPSNRLDGLDTRLVFDDALIPWENVLFHRHTRAAMFLRDTLHRYSAFAHLQRDLKRADMMIGAALLHARQGSPDSQPAVPETLARLAVHREGINAHLTAAIALAERSPGGLMMPNQSLLHAGRALACSQRHETMRIARELCGGRPRTVGEGTIGDDRAAEDRHRLQAFARDLLESDPAGRRPGVRPPALLAEVYRNFDWDGPLDLVRKSAGLSDPASPTRSRAGPPGSGHTLSPPAPLHL